MSAKETAPSKQATARRGALKRQDAEPLTRHDLQYDLLSYIFNDTHQVFTDPFSDPPGNAVTFRDLYVSAILHAPKTARSVRDKIGESPVFTTDIAMLSLLVNVGRVNTSMAFFPETRTALRTYHPVPALQRGDGNLTDAPRIRIGLKSVVLPSEGKHAPNTLFSILAQRETGPIPTTSIANLLFLFTQHSSNVGTSHFARDTGIEFIDLFQPVPIPSAERGRAFLWLVYHYLESSDSPNPFADPSSTDANPNLAPLMHRVDPSELATENIDTAEEKEYGEKMSEHRRQLLDTDKGGDVALSGVHEDGTPGDREASGTPAPSSVTAKSSKVIKPKGKPGRKPIDYSTRGPSDAYTKFRYEGQDSSLSRKPSLQLIQPDGTLTLAPPSVPIASHGHTHHHHHNQGRAAHDYVSGSVQEHTGRGRKLKRGMRTEPYEFVHSPERSMFQQAWLCISTRDVLYDSDEGGDEHVRLDLARRLNTLSRLRGKSPTPTPEPDPDFHPEVLPEPMHGVEPDHQVPPPSVMDVDERW